MSLRKRLSIATALVVLVTVSALAIAAYAIAGHELRSQVDDTLATRADAIVRQIDRELQRPRFPGRQQVPLGPTLLQPEFDAITQVIAVDGTILAVLGPAELPVTDEVKAMAASALPGRSGYVNATVNGDSYRVYTLTLATGGALQLGRDITDIEDARNGMRTWLIVLGIAGIALAAGVGWIIAWRTTRPIEQLAASARSIADTRNTDDPIDVKADGEVGNLVSSFNTMLEALGRSVAQQKQLVQDASHELRTPLTSLRANAELLSRDDLPADTRRAIITDIRVEIDELTSLSTELSALASDQRDTEEPSEIHLDDAVREIVERARRRSNRSVELHLTDPGRVMVRPMQFERAVSNLVDNALKFSPPDTRVDVFVAGTRIEVHDSGPGIAPEDRAFVFDRFYRAASTRSLPGSGLGLAIVKQFAEIHDARTLVGASGTGGAMVGLELVPLL
jgi:two-component system sensor histidine kinase MprB